MLSRVTQRAASAPGKSAVMNSVWVFATLIVRKFGNTAVALFLAAALGTAGYGVYGVAVSSLVLGATLALFGFERLTARETAGFLSKEAYGRLKYYLRSAAKILAFTTISVMFCGLIGLYLISYLKISDNMLIFYLALASVPIFACNRFLYGILCGFHRVVLGQTALAIIHPTIFLLLIGSYYVFNIAVTPWIAMLSYMAASASACVMMLWNTARTIPDEVREAELEPSSKNWLVSGAFFLALGLYPVVNTELTIIIIGALRGAESAGALKLAFEISGLVFFVSVAISAPLGPLVANRIAGGKIDDLVNDVANLMRLAFALAFPLALVVIILGKVFLGFFGEGFVHAYPALIILAVGQLLFVVLAPLGIVLDMAGYEQEASKGAGITIILTMSVTTMLIWFFGLEGAAIGMSIGLTFWNLLRIYFIQKILGISTRVIRTALWMGGNHQRG